MIKKQKELKETISALAGEKDAHDRCLAAYFAYLTELTEWAREIARLMKQCWSISACTWERRIHGIPILFVFFITQKRNGRCNQHRGNFL